MSAFKYKYTAGLLVPIPTFFTKRLLNRSEETRDACENRFFKQLLIWYRKDGFEITVLHLHSNLQTCWEASTKYLVDIRTTKRQIT